MKDANEAAKFLWRASHSVRDLRWPV
jgi:hypothetical protein